MSEAEQTEDAGQDTRGIGIFPEAVKRTVTYLVGSSGKDEEGTAMASY